MAARRNPTYSKTLNYSPKEAMMADSTKMTCLGCGAVNRVPEAKLGDGPKCGACGSKLADGKVAEPPQMIRIETL